MPHISNSCCVGKEEINIDVNRLFHWLAIVAERCDDVAGFFAYELTHYLTALFLHAFMRKPDKPALLCSALTDMTSEKLPSHCTYVIDGGCLLHKVHWGREKTISELVQQHVDYVTRKFGYWVVVVFDGYNDALSTKDHEHRRRQQRIHKVAPVVDVATSQVLGFDQDTFLASGQNKDSFILLLLAAFSTVGMKSLQAPGDADTVIVSEAYCMHPLQIAEVSQFLQTIQIFWPCYSTT